MKDLYLKILDTFIDNADIRQQYLDEGLNPVKHIDLYSGQDTNPQYFELAIYPALFIGFNIDHRQTPNLATITVRVCYEQLRDTSNDGPNIDEALKFLDFIRLTDEILQTLETREFGKLTPATTDQQTGETVTDEFVLTYEASYTKNTDRKTATGTYEDVEIKGKLFKEAFKML